MRLALFLVTAALGIADEFATSISGPIQDVTSAIATDPTGNTYVVGTRQLATGSGAVVTKLDASGKVLFTRIFAGTGVDTGAAITVDRSGNIYVGGMATSADFPLSHALQTQIYAGGPVNGVLTGSGFIVKLSGDGKSVLYSTLFGGTLGQSAITSLATDAAGNLYLTGYTQATDFPHTAGMPFGAIQQNPATPGAIIASISPDGDKIRYSGAIAMTTPCATSCISNGIQWEGVGIGVDAAGNAYIAGNDASSTNLPTTPGALAPNGIGAFVAKINAGGAGLGYLTYIGGGGVGTSPFLTPATTLYGIAVDASGNAHLAGRSFDPKFPATPDSYQATPSSPGRTEGFVAKLNPNGSAMVWATFLRDTAPQSIAIDENGNVWTTGTTLADRFPNLNGWFYGPEFLAGLNAAGSQLTYSALYPGGAIAQSVAIEPSGLVHVAGASGFVSTIAPATAPILKVFSLQNGAGGNLTSRISRAEIITIYGPGIGPASAEEAKPASGVYSTQLNGVQVAINGVSIPLLYVSANQINAIAPMGLPVDAAATLRIINGSVTSPEYPIWVVGSNPRAFAQVINQDGTINSQTNPAPAESVVRFYATGWQSSFTPVADGENARDPRDVCLGTCTASGSTVALPFIGSTSVTVAVRYGGTAPGFVAGVTQFDVQVGTPASVAAILYNLILKNSAGQSVQQGVWIRR